MKNQFDQLIALSLKEWWILLIAIQLLPVIALVLWLIGFKRTRKLLNHLVPYKSKFEQPDESKINKSRLIARMVAVAAGHGPYRANCLKQALVLWWLLAWYRILSEIKFGVQKDPEEVFGAHAWVECGGEILNDTREVHQRLSAFG